MSVGGLGVVTVRVRAGVLRLQDVVATHHRGDGAVRTLLHSNDSGNGVSEFLGGSLLVRGGSARSAGAVVSDGEEDREREEETRRMVRAELEARVGRGLYVAGAVWDEGNMVHAIRKFGGTTMGWRFGDG